MRRTKTLFYTKYTLCTIAHRKPDPWREQIGPAFILARVRYQLLSIRIHQ